jgi:hypothetical protein
MGVGVCKRDGCSGLTEKRSLLKQADWAGGFSPAISWQRPHPTGLEQFGTLWNSFGGLERPPSDGTEPPLAAHI